MKLMIDYDKMYLSVMDAALSFCDEDTIFDLMYDSTVDTVEVVRCKDCIGRSTWYNDAEYGCAVCGMSGMYPKNEDGYCSYWLRKGR